MRPLRVLETCLYVDDLDAAERFYRETLGLEFVSRREGRHVFFRCGPGMVLLFDAQASAADDGELPPHGAAGPGHLALAAGDDQIDRWREHLIGRGVAIEHQHDWPGGGRSLYFRDPAGNSLEIATPKLWGLGEATLGAPSPPDESS